jgi:hypothetical protein
LAPVDIAIATYLFRTTVPVSEDFLARTSAMQTALLLAFSVGALYVVQKLLDYRRAINSIQFVLRSSFWVTLLTVTRVV